MAEDYDTEGAPTTHEDDVAENIERIRSYLANPNSYLSTSQQIMVGLALCRPELLEAAKYSQREIKQAWGRLDEAQRQAVSTWWK